MKLSEVITSSELNIKKHIPSVRDMITQSEKEQESVAWTPANINTALWLDAADSDTVTLSGTNVVNWLDKSGNGRHTGSAVTAPIYVPDSINGLPVIRFNGTSSCWFNLDGKFPSTMSVNTMIVYNKPTSGGGDYQRVYASMQDPATTNTTGGIYLMPPFGSLGKAAGGPALTQGSGVSETNYFTAFRIARRGPNSYTARYLGDIAEFVISATKIDSSTIQKLEGYLAHKWGLTENLSVDHPYKTITPKA